MKYVALCALAFSVLPAVAYAQTADPQQPQQPPPPPATAQPAQPPPPAAQPVAQAQPALPPPPPGQPGYAQPYPPPGYAPQYAQPGYAPQQPVYGQPAYAQPVYGQPAYGQAPYGAPPPMLRSRVVEYRGGPIPPGATLETRRPMGFVIGGALLFGGFYLVSVLAATNTSGLVTCTTSACGRDWLYVPLVGPFVAAGQPGHGGTSDVGVLIIDGIAQLVGFAGVVFGAVHSRQVLVINQYVSNDELRRRVARPQWAIVPAAAGATAGLTLSVSRF